MYGRCYGSSYGDCVALSKLAPLFSCDTSIVLTCWMLFFFLGAVPEQQKQPLRHYESKMYPGYDHNLMKVPYFYVCWLLFWLSSDTDLLILVSE
jgi:hypothetical protein